MIVLRRYGDCVTARRGGITVNITHRCGGITSRGLHGCTFPCPLHSHGIITTAAHGRAKIRAAGPVIFDENDMQFYSLYTFNSIVSIEILVGLLLLKMLRYTINC